MGYKTRREGRRSRQGGRKEGGRKKDEEEEEEKEIVKLAWGILKESKDCWRGIITEYRYNILKIKISKYEKIVSILLPRFMHFKCPIMKASNIYKQKMHLFS